jgi:hypothetical protein
VIPWILGYLMSNISIEFRIENCGVNMTRKSVQI